MSSLKTPSRRKSLLPLILVTAISAAFGGIASNSYAALPGTIKPGHPRLLTNATDLAALKSQLPVSENRFDPTGGTISFRFLAKDKLLTGDITDAPLMGTAGKPYKNNIALRHVDSVNGGLTRIQIILMNNAGGYAAVGAVDVTINHYHNVSVSWNKDTKQVTASMDGTSVPMNIKQPAFDAWTANEHSFIFNPRKEETIDNFIVKDKTGNVISQVNTIDPALANAWVNFLSNVDSNINTLNSCNSVTAPASSVCNVSTGHRATVLNFAQQLGLAWRMTGNPAYKNAAFLHIDKMLSVPLTTGTEWTMGGRVSAMGIFYDWMFDEMGERYVPGDTRTYRQALAESIKNTIAATSSKPSDDLAASICATSPSSGPNITYNGSTLQCTDPLTIEGWNRWETPLKASTSNEYIMGHTFSAVHAISMGLLAIIDENPQVLPLLDTAYQQVDRGFIEARRQISIDGGHHTGYAYAALNIPERTLLWRNALQMANNSTPLFTGDWQNKLIYPFIYALRGDNSYPARGDDFGDVTPSALEIGQLALWAASNGNDGTALSFYKNTVIPKRGTETRNLVWERLYWPVSNYVQESPVANLDKSRYFRVAGQVIMRDLWETDKATVIDFKSSNFLSENHQHLDQNSFSLFYKKPLLLDSGMYDEYGSQHWQNYYTRTVAHNTITVFDQNERFRKNDREYSNDGGQWFRNSADNANSVTLLYPTLEEIKPNPANPQKTVYTDGVQQFEYNPAYTFVSANASKAYSQNKMKQDNGFVRNMVFLPQPTFGGKPVTVVFDSVRTETMPGTNFSFKADFQLHPAGDPLIGAGTQGLGNGRYQVQFGNSTERKLTVRNGEGMLVVQTLLPQNASVLKVGGNSGSSCSQIDPANGNVLANNSGDCRFVTRQLTGTNPNTHAWRNYPEKLGSDGKTSQSHSTSEIGTWRLEYSMPDSPKTDEAQYFLNVMSVAANDSPLAPSTVQGAAPSASRIGSDANTEAVLLNDALVVAFNRGTQQASNMSWTGSKSDLKILATGLKPNTSYSLNVLPSGNNFTYSLVQTTGGAYQSSAQGVISVGM